MLYASDDIVKCPVLMYTSVNLSDNDDTSYSTTNQKFQMDMKTILQNGYTPISLREAYECRKGERTWKDKPICVIFVGGYENNYTLAFPFIKEMNIPVSIFVATSLVGVRKYGSSHDFKPHFDLEQAKEMLQSELIEIFPMWHLFDQGKPISEAFEKIAYLRNNIGGDPSFAIAYNDCTYDELGILNEAGYRVCISDCFHITGQMLDKGVIPSIFVNHTSDVLDIINQYTELCIDALEKEKAKFYQKEYVEPSSEVLAESFSLPIDNMPMARNYLRHAFPFSILQAENKERAERLLLNDYIDVIYRPWDKWYDYHNYLYNSWECFEYKRISGDLLEANKINIVEYLIRALSLGYYCDIWLDTYYIPGKPGYGKKHMTHGVLVFSYSAEIHEFTALSYDAREHYNELHIPIRAMFMGCSNRYFDYANLIKNRKSTLIEYDVQDLYSKLHDYIHSICHDDNKRYSKKSSQQYYNYAASLKFVENFPQEVDKNKSIHMISLYSFAEHKRIMMWRVKYIAEKEKIPFDFCEINTSTCKETERLINLGLKYNFTHKSSICDNMISIMQKLCENELFAIKELLKYSGI